MKKVLTLLIVLFSLQQSFSQDFKLGFTSGEDEYYMREERNNEAWVKCIKPIKKVKNKSGKLITTGGGYTLYYIKCNSSDRSYSIGETIIYDRQGNVKSSVEGSLYATDKIIPDSIIEGICKIIFKEKAYEEDLLAKKQELNDFVKRYDNHRDGFVKGYLEEKCKPYAVANCTYKIAPDQDESYFAEDPKNDFKKGYDDGVSVAQKENAN